MSKNQEVIIESKFPLSGTLTIPSETNDIFPAVLILSGSGKGDRDGNLKNMKINLYKELADFLTSKGFVTLRYDKRGTYRSKGNFLEMGLSDLIEDAAECLKFLRTHPLVDNENIFILGHSEGALIAPAVHKKMPVSGLILLAGAAESSKNLSQRQTEGAYMEMEQATGFKGWLFRILNATEKARKQNKKIFAKIADSEKAVMRIQGIRLNAKYLRETMNYDVSNHLKDVTCPVLAITGEKDIQVPPNHAQKIAETVNGEAEWHVIPNMNHILRKYDGDHTMLGLLKEYKKQLNQPIDRELLDKIEAWLPKYLQN